MVEHGRARAPPFVPAACLPLSLPEDWPSAQRPRAFRDHPGWARGRSSVNWFAWCWLPMTKSFVLFVSLLSLLNPENYFLVLECCSWKPLNQIPRNGIWLPELPALHLLLSPASSTPGWSLFMYAHRQSRASFQEGGGRDGDVGGGGPLPSACQPAHPDTAKGQACDTVRRQPGLWVAQQTMSHRT